MNNPVIRIGVDTGGTFTDIILVRDEQVFQYKLLSSPDDPCKAVIDGIKKILNIASAGKLSSLFRIIHGSTVATNALLEKKGAKAALVTTLGFEDVLEMGRQERPCLHSLRVKREEPLIPAQRRFGIDERIGPDASVIRPLDEKELNRIIDLLKKPPENNSGAAEGCKTSSLYVEENIAENNSPFNNIESVAVVLLHSYKNPEHEMKIASAIRKELGIPVTESHRLLPEYREYERTSTCVINAYVAPIMSGYLERLEKSVSGASLLVMRSDGGIMKAASAAKNAVHTVFSGPAGGVTGGAFFASRTDNQKNTDESSSIRKTVRAITFDMGGTSTDVCLVDGKADITRNSKIGSYPIRVPVMDIHTVGAGGGSIAWMDAGGALKVGPESAGSSPGPACYGLGGSRPTVTDANVVLGRLPRNLRPADSFEIDFDASHRCISKLADRLGIKKNECATGIIKIANTVMMRAIRRISVEKGHDPRLFTLVGFGGAGGLHACELAESLSMKKVIIPPHPGLLSAFGMLAARPERETGKTVLETFSNETQKNESRNNESRNNVINIANPEEMQKLSALSALYLDLEKEIVKEMEEEGVDPVEIRTEWLADMRYFGQSHELTVPVPLKYLGDAGTYKDTNYGTHKDTYKDRHHDNSESLRSFECRIKKTDPAALMDAVSSFQTEHEQFFGHRLHLRVEWVTARIRAFGKARIPDIYTAPVGKAEHFDGGEILRDSIPAGSVIRGPAIITEYSATTYLPPEWTASAGKDGSLIISRSSCLCEK